MQYILVESEGGLTNDADDAILFVVTCEEVEVFVEYDVLRAGHVSQLQPNTVLAVAEVVAVPVQHVHGSKGT